MLISVSPSVPPFTRKKFGYGCTTRADGKEWPRKSSVMESKLSNVSQSSKKLCVMQERPMHDRPCVAKL